MKYLISLALTLLLFSACMQTTAQVIDLEEMDRIKIELGIKACQTRMDSLSFEIDGLLYHAVIGEDSRPLHELLPDSLPVCPVSGLEYIIDESSSSITVSCPSGHGSVILEK